MQLLLEDFKFGLDRRKFTLNAPPGTLYNLVNAHITSGGEIEKRKAFTFAALPTNCYGLEVVPSGFLVFGSVPLASLNAALPSGFEYQQLAHPNGTGVMTQVIHSTVYNSAAFVIADFGADGIVSFYDGEVVDDLSPGKLASILTDADALAEYIAGLIDALDDYEASASSGTVTVEGPDGQTFSVSASNESTCTEPLDTSEPDVTGVDVVACTALVAVTSSYDTGTNQVVYGYTDGVTPTNFDLLMLVDVDGVTQDIKAMADAEPLTMTGGAGHQVYLFFQAGPVDNLTGTITFSVTYSNGATKNVTIPFTAPATESTEYYFDLDADPPEETPSITPSVVTAGTPGNFGGIPQTQLTVMAVKPAGTGKMTSITIDGTEVLGTAATDLNGTNYATVELLAEAIKTQINTYCAAQLPPIELAASRVDNTVVIRATDPDDYDSWTGDSVIVTVEDEICIGSCGLTFSRSSQINDPTWDSITVNGVDILGATVNWNTDLATSVADVAAQIITFTDEYTAVAVGATLYISKKVTSSGDAPMQVVVSGAYLLYNEIGSNNGTQGGAFPGTILVESLDVPYRLFGPNTLATLEPLKVVATGGLPPYLYKWERSSGDTTVRASTATSDIDLGAPRIQTPSAPSTYIVGPLKTQSAYTFAPYEAGYRCQITDSLNRVGYSPEIKVHYP